MNQLSSIILFFSILITGFSVLSETVGWKDLVEREGLHFKKFSNKPYTGDIKESGSYNFSGKFKDGKRDGLWLYFFDNGQLKEEFNYKDGLLNGSTKIYDEGGLLKEKGFYKNGSKDGFWKRYAEPFSSIPSIYNMLDDYGSNSDENDEEEKKYKGEIVLKEKGSYQKGQKHGEWYYYEGRDKYSNPLWFKKTYNQGIEDGPWVEYLRDGRPHKKGIMKNGEKEGIWEIFMGDRSIASRENYKNGKPHGLQVSFNPDGTINKKRTYKNGFIISNKTSEKKFIGGFKDGKKNGLWITYFDDGQLREKGAYKAGVKDGFWKYFNAKGEVIAEGNYLDGIKDGTWLAYDAWGYLSDKENYQDGIGEGIWEKFYPTGSLWQKKHLKNGKLNGIFEKYKPEGQIIEKLSFKNDILDGPAEYYNSLNGKLGKKGNYKNGKKDGYWEKYYYTDPDDCNHCVKTTYGEDGIISWDVKEPIVYDHYFSFSRGLYRKDLMEGLWESYYFNGELEWSGYFKKGEAEGVHKIYCKDGILKETQTWQAGVGTSFENPLSTC